MTILKGLNLFGCLLRIIYLLTCVISACDTASLNLKACAFELSAHVQQLVLPTDINMISFNYLYFLFALTFIYLSVRQPIFRIKTVL